MICDSSRYLSAAESHLRLGDRVTAKGYSKRGLEMEEVCLGTDNPLYKESVARMRKISMS